MCAILFGVLLLVWPLFAFGAIFIFDAPITSRGDAANRYLFAFSIWLYPILYFLSVLIARRLLKAGLGAWTILLPFLLPAVPPLICVLEFTSNAAS
ncbi:hypothetical protein DB347_22725 [Opitutaceae bacterium EW11]|nr:hypothetical protein DB347_22725 [Opitutaceae bacterium EW11]